MWPRSKESRETACSEPTVAGRPRVGIRRYAFLTALFSVCTLSSLPAARGDLMIADLLISAPAIDSSTASGTIEVDLTNTSATNIYTISGFQFEISVPADSGIQFTDATTAKSAAHAYIFTGDSFVDQNPPLTLYSSTVPTTDLYGNDFAVIFDPVTMTDVSTFTTVAPGQSYELAFVSYTVMSGSGGLVPVTVVPFDSVNDTNGTELIDGSGNVIPNSVIPEPSTFFMGGSAIALFGLGILRKRRRPAH